MKTSEFFFVSVSSKSKAEPNKSAAISNKLAKSLKAMEAIDISSGMIKVAKERAEAESINNISYSETSIFDERFKEESFDVILAFNVLHCIEDIPSLIKRIRSLLKPKGVFISSTACLKEKKSLLRYGLFWLIKVGVVPKMNFMKELS
ncbi:MAG: 2-polyprenyl-3-methyl-5-hydroxy-6-metoxy-1,4-benzoquinol methylase [Chitinophagales bacterium]|jgi:2-polyprenyl-3-methyl-5-hydroxy-6-metoxy-1,4-benzoquinol methylase